MTEKLLTIVVPAYNVESYIRRCLGSLVTADDSVEIIVVNDGSLDRTLEIAQEYEKLYPSKLVVVTKENGGHGSTINTGLELAKGKYFYVVDSDDWLEVGGFEKLLKVMKEVQDRGEDVDLFIVNYIYNQFEINKRHVVHYKNVFPQMQVFQWKDSKSFNPIQFVTMHSTIHKTSILRETGVRLPEHTFYVDNILVYNTLPAFKNLFYIDVDLYQYYIGRDDQSVTSENIIKRIDQYIRVIKSMIEAYHLEEIEDEKLKRYMYNYLDAIYTIVNTFLTLSKKEENIQKKAELKKFLKNYDKKMYRKLKMKFKSGISSSIDGRMGRFILRSGYLLGRKIYKYN